MITRIKRSQGKEDLKGINTEEGIDLSAQGNSQPNQRHGVWFRCSEKLPKKSSRYIIAYRKDPKARLTLFICDYNVENNKWIGMHLFPVEVVYWMRVKLPS